MDICVQKSHPGMDDESVWAYGRIDDDVKVRMHDLKKQHQKDCESVQIIDTI